MNRSRSIGALLLFLIAAFAVAAGAEKKYDKRFSATAGGTFIVRGDVGSISVEGTDAKEVSILAEMRGRQRDLDDYEISAWQTDNGVEMKLKNLRKSSKWFNWGDDGLDARITVSVPKEYNLILSTAGGDLKVKTVKGKVNGGTSGGNLEVYDVTGAIELETSGGDIRADKIQGQLTMETSGGNIRIKEVKGDVDVNTSGGDVVLSGIDGKVRAETSGGNITMKVLESNRGIFAETSGGNIDIVLPKNISASVDASTSGGEVNCDFPITMQGKLDESRIRGSINGGGNSIRAHTSGGNIRISGAE